MSVAGGKNFTLDLAGYKIDRGLTEATDDGNVITVYGALTVIDSSATSTSSGTGVITGGKSGSGGGIAIYHGGSFTLSGGKISGNTASLGGGIYINSGGIFILSGGEISGNTASQGGGVYANAFANSFTISGGTISCNTKNGAVNNVYLYGDTKITVGGELSETTSIGITMNNPGVFTNSLNPAYNAAARFTSDNGNYVVGKNADGQLYLGESRTLTYKANGGTGDDVTETYESGSNVIVKDVTDTTLSFTRKGYIFTNGNHARKFLCRG